jgi:SAM-dependent methyltransferase
VKLAPSGRTIYEDASPVFFDPEQADYYRDPTAVEAARLKLAWVQKHVPSGMRLLDVGANFGLFVREASRYYEAVGLEPSPTVVSWARQEIGAPLEIGSIYDEDGRFDGRFDIVTLFDVVEHLPDPQKALSQCRRFLRKGGYLFLTTPNTGSLMRYLLGRHWYYIDLDEHVALFNRHNLKTVLERAGFTLLERRSIGRQYRLSYIRRRLRFLGRHAPMLRVAHAATWPLRFLPRGRVTINFGDVMGVVASRTES